MEGKGTMEPLSQEETWAVIDSFFKEKGLVRQQIESFDDFLTHTLQDIIDDTPPLTVSSPRPSGSLQRDMPSQVS
jgi:DNA-directed RNA polymerase II subunit RPB2